MEEEKKQTKKKKTTVACQICWKSAIFFDFIVSYFRFVYIHVYQRGGFLCKSVLIMVRTAAGLREEEGQSCYVKELDLDIIDHYTEQTTEKKKKKKKPHNNQFTAPISTGFFCCNLRLFISQSDLISEFLKNVSLTWTAEIWADFSTKRRALIWTAERGRGAGAWAAGYVTESGFQWRHIVWVVSKRAGRFKDIPLSLPLPPFKNIPTVTFPSHSSSQRQPLFPFVLSDISLLSPFSFLFHRLHFFSSSFSCRFTFLPLFLSSRLSGLFFFFSPSWTPSSPVPLSSPSPLPPSLFSCLTFCYPRPAGS